MTELKSLTEAAKMLNLTRMGVWYAYERGEFPNASKVGNQIVIPLLDIQNFKSQSFRKAEGA